LEAVEGSRAQRRGRSQDQVHPALGRVSLSARIKRAGDQSHPLGRCASVSADVEAGNFRPNRGELNFSNGGLTWRYRNRLQLEREITIRRYHPTPYANIEVYYDSMFHKWSSTAIEAGSQFPFQRHYEIDVYYEHQNNTGTPHNQ
jgi:hypothetical protein